MGLYTTVFDQVLSKLDPEQAHHGAAALIGLAGAAPVAPLVRATLGRVSGRRAPRRVFGREVNAPLGIAAGFDKNATMASGLAAMGFGFVEVGTITAHTQPGNDRPRLFRIPAERALRNRMGFNNDGAEVIGGRLAALRRTARGKRLILGANIGKSKIATPGEAVADYATSAKAVAPHADYLVVNVSSPNTPGLRDLQAVSSLRPILAGVRDAANHSAAREVPVLVKIAPDLAGSDIEEIADLVPELGLAGVVAVNTTIAHDHGAGGLSGPMLLPRGLEVVASLRSRLGDDAVIIGVGGISSAADLDAYLDAGATLAQAYTGFIYGGGMFPGRVNRGTRR